LISDFFYFSENKDRNVVIAILSNIFFINGQFNRCLDSAEKLVKGTKNPLKRNPALILDLFQNIDDSLRYLFMMVASIWGHKERVQ